MNADEQRGKPNMMGDDMTADINVNHAKEMECLRSVNFSIRQRPFPQGCNTKQMTALEVSTMLRSLHPKKACLGGFTDAGIPFSLRDARIGAEATGSADPRDTKDAPPFRGVRSIGSPSHFAR